MNKFDLLITKLGMENSCIVIEHCKVAPYFKPFNLLQLKILKTLYYKYLKDKVTGFDNENITSDSDIFMMFFDKLPEALHLLGDVMCKHIPDEKTIRYKGSDVKNWATELYTLLNK